MSQSTGAIRSRREVAGPGSTYAATAGARRDDASAPGTAAGPRAGSSGAEAPADDGWPDIIAVHGMWETGKAMHVVRDLLAERGWRVHCPTLPWHGDDDPAARRALGRASLRDYADFLEGYVDSLRLRRPPVLLGLSMGGTLIQIVASRVPVSALVLLAPGVQTNANLLNVRSLRAFVPALLRWAFVGTPRLLPFRDLCGSFANGLDPAKQREIYGMMCPESGRTVFEMGFPLLDVHRSLSIDHSKFKFPVLLQVGSDDLICTPYLQRAYNLPLFVHGIDFRVYPNTPHWIVDCPATPAVCADVDSFLRSRLGLGTTLTSLTRS
eukprot:tig00000178_g12718.t1